MCQILALPMQPDIIAGIALVSQEFNFFFVQVNRLFSNKVLMDFLEKGEPSTFGSPSVSLLISLPFPSLKILKICREDKILCCMKSQISIITLQRFFPYNFFFNLCDSFISVKTMLKWIVCGIHPLLLRTGMLVSHLLMVSCIYLHHPQSLS